MSDLPNTAPELRCFDDLDLFATETASDLEVLEQDVFHILIETPGSNLDAPNRGIGIEEVLSGPDLVLDDTCRRIEAELLKDDRIDAVAATITQVGDPGSYRLEIDVTVGAATLGLAFSFTRSGGLIAG